MLERILFHKRQEVAERTSRRPLSELAAAAKNAGPIRPFSAAVRRDNGPVRLIAEIKRASPSRGLLCRRFSAPDLARAYTDGGAAAISVLTDKAFFRGDLAFVREVKRVSPLPVLQKDFIVDPYQVYEARVVGADAVLLIVAALEGNILQELLELASDLGLAALVEVHCAAELERALEAGADLVGINNRDLRTFRTDLSVTESLVKLIPPGVVVVSESGLKCAADVRRVAEAGVDAVLVGEALVTSNDAAAKLRELVGA